MELPGIRKLVHRPLVDSTQTVARELAEHGAEEGTLVWADEQSRGRGRMERSWQSPPGGLYLSLILRPKMAPQRLAELSLAAAEAVAKALSHATGLETAVKPPNDVFAKAPGPSPEAEASPNPGRLSAQDVPAGYKKVSGILVEASGGPSHIDWILIGIGVNVNNEAPKSIPLAGSLKDLAGRQFEIEALLRLILEEFQSKYRGILSASNGHMEKPH